MAIASLLHAVHGLQAFVAGLHMSKWYKQSEEELRMLRGATEDISLARNSDLRIT